MQTQRHVQASDADHLPLLRVIICTQRLMRVPLQCIAELTQITFKRYRLSLVSYTNTSGMDEAIFFIFLFYFYKALHLMRMSTRVVWNSIDG